jgi:group I intron endonuclease
MHTCPNGKKYIGITGQDVKKRWNYGHGYDSQLFGRAVKKYGWENITHEILFDGLTLDEAYQRERESIASFKAKDPKHGYNCDNGGAGADGHVVSDKTRKYMSEHTKQMWEVPEIKQKLLEHLKRLNSSKIGKPMPCEAVRKSAITRGKKVAQYTMDGEYIQTFLTATDAAHSVGRKSNSLIIRCCKSEKYTAYGYIWRYAS